jgi:regulator of sigma E protease
MIAFQIAIAFGLMVFIHELGHFLVLKKIGVPVKTFSLGFGPKIIKFKYGETEYCISAIPLGGYVKPLGEEPPEKGEEIDPAGFLGQPPLKRIGVAIAGVALNYIMALLLLSAVFMFVRIPLPVIGELTKGYPAEKAGLQKGDQITAINGKQIKSFNEMCQEIYPNTGKKLTLVIQRNNSIFEERIIPIEGEIEAGPGKKKKVGLIGIRPSQTQVRKYGIGEAIWKGFKQGWFYTRETYKFLGKAITFQIGLKSLKKNLAGPAGIIKIMTEQAREGFINFLHVVAIVSLNLAIINLLPIPILDGGHILFAAIEGIMRKRVSFKVQEVASYIGLSLILCLVFFATYNDFSRNEWLTKLFGWVKNIF